MVYEYSEEQKIKKYFIERVLANTIHHASSEDIELIAYVASESEESVIIGLANGDRLTVQLKSGSLYDTAYEIFKATRKRLG